MGKVLAPTPVGSKKKLANQFLPGLTVLAFDEIPPGVDMETLTTINL